MFNGGPPKYHKKIQNKSHSKSIQTTCKLFNFLTDSPDLIGELCPLRLVGDVVGEDGAAESEDEDGLRLEGVSQG